MFLPDSIPRANAGIFCEGEGTQKGNLGPRRGGLSPQSPLVPDIEERACNENRRVDADGNSDEEGENKVKKARRAGRKQRYQDQDQRKRSVHRARECLIDAFVHHFSEISAAAVEKKIFAYAVKNHNRVMHGKTHHHKERHDEIAVNLHERIAAEKRE